MRQLAPGIWETAHLEELQGWTILRTISRDRSRFFCEAKNPEGIMLKVYVCDSEADLLTPEEFYDDDWDPIER